MNVLGSGLVRELRDGGEPEHEDNTEGDGRGIRYGGGPFTAFASKSLMNETRPAPHLVPRLEPVPKLPVLRTPEAQHPTRVREHESVRDPDEPPPCRDLHDPDGVPQTPTERPRRGKV